MLLVESRPRPVQDEVLLAEWLRLLLLLASQEELQVLALLEGELKRPEQELMRKSEAGPGDSESA